MKKLILSLISIAILQSVSATNSAINFFQGSLGEALETAKNENKLIFIEAYADWCGPCKVMEKEVFSDKSVGQFYNQNFINVKLDVDREEGILFQLKHEFEGIPFFAFLNKNGNLVHNDLGMIDSDELIKLGELALRYQEDMDLSLNDIKTLVPRIANELCESFNPMIELNDSIEKAKKEGDENNQKKLMKRVETMVQKFEKFWAQFEETNRGRMKNDAFANAIRNEVKATCPKVFEVMYGEKN